MSFESVTSFTDPRFTWFHHPESWQTLSGESSGANAGEKEGEREGSGGRVIEHTSERLIFRAPAKKDFWSRTFYTPLLIKSDASAYLVPVPEEYGEVTVSVDFSLNPLSQFDQAGLLIYLDNDHWMKCGIEYCDGLARLSVVVCNAGYSDWSTQIWPNKEVIGARLRVHKVLQSSSVVVEASPLDSEEFYFVRIAHLGKGEGEGQWRVGPFAACPVKQVGCEATFTNFSLGPRIQSTHSSSL